MESFLNLGNLLNEKFIARLYHKSEEVREWALIPYYRRSYIRYDEGSLIVATNYFLVARSRPFVNQNFTGSFNPDLPLAPSAPVPVPLRHLVSQTPVTLQTRRPPIDVRVNERRPRQQRVTEPGGQAFCVPLLSPVPLLPSFSPRYDHPLEFRGWLWLSTANECATGSAFWSTTRARGYCRLVKQHLDSAGKRVEGFSFWAALPGRGGVGAVQEGWRCSSVDDRVAATGSSKIRR